MSDIKLAGAQWSWVGASFAESANIYKAIGVEAMDLIAMPGGLLDVGDVARDPKAAARQLAEVDIDLVNLLVLLGDDFADRALNSPAVEVRRQNSETLTAVVEFCAAAGMRSICLLPGVEQTGMSRADAQALAADELRAAVAIGADCGLGVFFEPHRESVLERPDEIVAFMEKNDDLRIVIDYSHCVSIGHREEELHPLLPYAGHVHLRQGANGSIQSRWGDGEIDFEGLMRRLVEIGYSGYATLEYEHEEVWDMDRCDTMKETLKMRDVVRPFIAG